MSRVPCIFAVINAVRGSHMALPLPIDLFVCSCLIMMLLGLVLTRGEDQLSRLAEMQMPSVERSKSSLSLGRDGWLSPIGWLSLTFMAFRLQLEPRRRVDLLPSAFLDHHHHHRHPYPSSPTSSPPSNTRPLAAVSFRFDPSPFLAALIDRDIHRWAQ